ncbi:histidinol-phosphate transaminase [Halothiobacillus sp. DCM-1]|uniref:histidinol-phosphate transaminase n=1 Tax=Halothiobacillus sp. DCM-1 TaxID=3112558 RepID=UPI00324A9D94
MSETVPVAEAALGYVCAISPYVTGKPIDAVAREFGLTDIIKLASNENPLGASPKAQAALREPSALNIYPDGGGFALKQAIAHRFAVSMESIVLGNGSNDLLELAARAYLAPGRNAVFSAYAFAVYALATQAVGAEAKVVPALPPDHPSMPYGADLSAMRAAIDDQTRVVFLANPNNPTGTWVDAAALESFIAAIPSRVLIVLDEAYSEYVPPDWYADGRFPDGLALAKRYPNVLLTRTFSKIYGLAALRVGFGLAHPAVAAILERVRQPFNVNTLAQQAAVAAIDDLSFLDASRAANEAGLQQLQAACAARGWPVIPSRANFLTVGLGVPAGRVFDALLREGVIIRPLGGQQDTGGLSCHIRITVGTAEQNERVMAALDRVLPALRAAA